MEDERGAFLRPIKAFQALDIGKSRGYEGLKKGEIPSVVIAGQLRIPRRWIQEQVEKALGNDR
jgi:hypothetical protein